MTGTIANIEVVVFESGVAAEEIDMPIYSDEDEPFDTLTPYFRFANN